MREEPKVEAAPEPVAAQAEAQSDEETMSEPTAPLTLQDSAPTLQPDPAPAPVVPAPVAPEPQAPPPPIEETPVAAEPAPTEIEAAPPEQTVEAEPEPDDERPARAFVGPARKLRRRRKAKPAVTGAARPEATESDADHVSDVSPTTMKKGALRREGLGGDQRKRRVEGEQTSRKKRNPRM